MRKLNRSTIPVTQLRYLGIGEAKRLIRASFPTLVYIFYLLSQGLSCSFLFSLIHSYYTSQILYISVCLSVSPSHYQLIDSYRYRYTNIYIDVYMHMYIYIYQSSVVFTMTGTPTIIFLHSRMGKIRKKSLFEGSLCARHCTRF